MKVYILDDYDYDCEVRREDHEYGKPYGEELYEVSDTLVQAYEEVNNHREELRNQILLIKRQAILAAKLEATKDGVKPKGFN